MTHVLRCTFRPQTWQNNYAVPVDPEGETTWVMEHEDPLPRRHDYESDQLRHDPAAPEWVKEWSGPFEVDYEVVAPELTDEIRGVLASALEHFHEYLHDHGDKDYEPSDLAVLYEKLAAASNWLEMS